MKFKQITSLVLIVGFFLSAPNVASSAQNKELPEEVQKTVYNCLQTFVLIGLDSYGKHKGPFRGDPDRFDLSQDTITRQGKTYPIYYQNGKNVAPEEGEMEQALATYVENRGKKCIQEHDFKSDWRLISFKNQADIRPNNIVFHPGLSFQDPNEELVTKNPTIEFKSPLYSMSKAITDYMHKQSTDPSSLLMSTMTDLGIENDLKWTIKNFDNENQPIAFLALVNKSANEFKKPDVDPSKNPSEFLSQLMENRKKYIEPGFQEGLPKIYRFALDYTKRVDKDLCHTSPEDQREARKTLQQQGHSFTVNSFLKEWNNWNEEVTKLYWKAGIANQENLIEEVVHNDDLNHRSSLIDQAAKCGTNINATNENGKPLLYQALEGFFVRPSIIQALVENGAKINHKLENGQTALHLVAEKGSESITKTLVNHGASINERDEKGRTPLHVAAYKNQSKTMEVLLDHGAKVNLQDTNGQTPLHRASKTHLGADNTVQLLIDNGAKIDIKDSNGKKPIQLAAAENNPSALIDLVKNGADVSLRTDYEYTPLHHMADEGNPEATQILIANGASIQSRDYKKRTPLHLASYNDYPKTVKVLLENGAEINPTSKSGETPLHYACSSYTGESKKVVKLLLQNGSKINFTDNDGETPLHEAVRSEDKRLVQYMIDQGAAVNQSDNSDKTPIFEVHSKQMAKVLIDNGANIDITNNDGATPDEYISEHSNQETADYVEQIRRND